jgi:hypothetical protein
MPILPFAVALASSAAVLVVIASLLVARSCDAGDRSVALLIVVGTGFALRLLLFASDPVLEVDFNRYLWDGGVTASGYNPYAVSPLAISGLPYDHALLELSKTASPAFERISYPELKTVYPPVAQAAFALAHWLAPWSLAAWRLVCLAGEAATLVLLLALLREVGRSPLFAALYWWNPLVLKEIANSAHMEAVLMPAVLATVLLSLRGRHLSATLALAVAAGIKVWPLALAPLVLAPLATDRPRLALAAATLASAIAALLLPVWLGGLDASSGFVAFAGHWSTNSAHFPALAAAFATLLGETTAHHAASERLARAVCALAVLAVALHLGVRRLRDPADAPRQLARFYWTATAVVLLSPAQFPWYVLWVLPLAVARGGSGWLVATVTLPLYYAAFHLRLRGQAAVFDTHVVWLVWLPVWLAIARDALIEPRAPRSAAA